MYTMKVRTALPLLASVCALLASPLFAGLRGAAAQRGVQPWTQPINVSRSGAALQPTIAVDTQGTLYAFWWDSVLGELYSTTGLTQTVASAPAALPEVYGDRIDTVDPNTQRRNITLVQPLQARALADSTGTVHLFWLDTRYRLMTLEIAGARVSAAASLASSVLTFDISTDGAGGVHLAYVKTNEGQSSPAGVFYRYYSAGTWQAPALVISSRYFRSMSSAAASISVAGNEQGLALVAWDDPRLQNGQFARTLDGAKTWSQPQSIASTNQAVQIRAAYLSGQQFMMLWREAQSGTCVIDQSISVDGLQTWGAPVRVLSDLTHCPGQWGFASGGDGVLWLLGMSTTYSQGASAARATGDGVLAAWDGRRWSRAIPVDVSFEDRTISQTVNLSCIGLAMTGAVLGVVGCDPRGDVWIAHNNAPVRQLDTLLKPAWSAINDFAQLNKTTQEGDLLGAVEGAPVMVSDGSGQLYAFWGQAVQATKPYIPLFGMVWNGDSWSRFARVLSSPAIGPAGDGGRTDIIDIAAQPSLALDTANNLHAVWNSGSIGNLYYSRATVRSPLSPQEWITPVNLLPADVAGSWPQIVADPRGAALYVIYAVPYNESRGIYLLQSGDGGRTWTKPARIYDAAAAGWLNVDKPRLLLDATTGILHAVWLGAAVKDGNMSRAVFYSASADSGKTWRQPAQLATGLVDWPRLVGAGGNQLIVLWNRVALSATSQSRTPMSAYVRVSQDNGSRWNEPLSVAGFEHVSGPVDAVSTGEAAQLIGVSETSTKESALVYCEWVATGCRASDTYNLGQPAMVGNTAAIVPMLGKNRLAVLARVWVRQWGGSGDFGLLSTMREVSGTMTIQSVPTLTPSPEQTPQATPTLEPVPTATPTLAVAVKTLPGDTKSSQDVSPLVLSGIVTMVIVIGAVTLMSMARSRR